MNSTKDEDYEAIRRQLEEFAACIGTSHEWRGFRITPFLEMLSVKSRTVQMNSTEDYEAIRRRLEELTAEKKIAETGNSSPTEDNKQAQTNYGWPYATPDDGA